MMDGGGGEAEKVARWLARQPGSMLMQALLLLSKPSLFPIPYPLSPILYPCPVKSKITPNVLRYHTLVTFSHLIITL